MAHESRVKFKMYCDEIVISDAIIRTVNLEMTLLVGVRRGLKFFLRLFQTSEQCKSNLAEKKKSYAHFYDRKFIIFCMGRYGKLSVFSVPRNEF